MTHLAPRAGEPDLGDAADRAFLLAVGKRAREIREQRRLARKVVSQESGLSERYLALVEAGGGNISIVLLRHLALVLRVSLADIVIADHGNLVRHRLIRQFLERLPRQRMEEAIFRLASDCAVTDFPQDF